MFLANDVLALMNECIQDLDGVVPSEFLENPLRRDDVLMGDNNFDSFSLVSLFVALEKKIEESLGIKADVTTHCLTKFSSKRHTVDDICTEVVTLVESHRMSDS